MFVYLDTETTGRGIAWGDKIVEISIVGENGFVLLDTLVDPERDIPWQVTQRCVKGTPLLKNYFLKSMI